MVTDEEFAIAVLVIRIGRGEPISIAGHRRDQVWHYSATTGATTAACRLYTAGDHPQATRDRQELGGV